MVKAVLVITLAGAFGGMIIGGLINPSTGPNQATVLHQESIQNIQERTQKPNLAEQKWIENNMKSMKQFNMTGTEGHREDIMWELTSGDQ